MTVRELIRLLEQHPDDMPVLMSDGRREGAYRDVRVGPVVAGREGGLWYDPSPCLQPPAEQVHVVLIG